MTIDASDGVRRRRISAAASRTTSRREDCLTGLLHGLTDIPSADLWAAFAQLPFEERDRLCDLAREIVETSARPPPVSGAAARPRVFQRPSRSRTGELSR